MHTGYLLELIFKNAGSYFEQKISDKHFRLIDHADNLILIAEVTLQYEVNSFNELSGLQSGKELRVNSDRIRMLFNQNNKEDKKMDSLLAQSYGLTVDVSVGNIEMSLADVIAIEKGDLLISKLPVSNYVKLMIAGEVIANASFSFDNDEIILKVNETFLKNAGNLGDNNLE